MLNKKLNNIHNNLDNYFLENVPFKTYDKKVMNFVLDIEACPTGVGNEVLTYSTAIMSCDNDDYICNKYNKVDDVIDLLINCKCEKINIYVHNLYYDIKPYVIRFIERFGNKQILEQIYEKEYLDPFTKKKTTLKVMKSDKDFSFKDKFSYKLNLKKGQLYSASFYGENIVTRNKRNRKIIKPIEINFFDTYKIIPYSLQKSCSAFLDLELPKDGLDYEKIRNIDDELTNEEKVYIYNDVFGLSELVKKLIINGFWVDGKKVQYTKLTNSSQSLSDYKSTLLEDYDKNQNCFSDKFGNLYMQTQHKLMMNTKFELENDEEKRKDILFKSVFPPQNYFIDGFIRHSYYGGLSTVHYKNVEKYSKLKYKTGLVFDVNSLYPFIMLERLLPYGQPTFNNKPYIKMDKKYKELYPLYIQEITIYDMKIKKNKMPFVQVKDNKDFNGRDILEENINLEGKKVPIKLVLCNPLLELLFENYNINGYKLGCHLGFQGANDLFKNYLTFWGDIKKASKGANREIAKLRQNALYGKFGSSGDNEVTLVDVVDSTFQITHTHEEYVSDNIYVAMSSFITSYAKQYLVQAINNNYKNFLYCDTDSLHLFGSLEEVKGLYIHSKDYGAWKHEMTFNDFKYIGAKRYAEKELINQVELKNKKIIKLDNFYLEGKWDIKCCGLSDSIMKQVDDIEVFSLCEYTSKELKKVKLYTRENDIYYYKDKDFKVRVKGLLKSKKAKIVKGGTLIVEQPYMITNNKFML